MTYVLITLSGGIIDEVAFYKDQETAQKDLSRFVSTMDPENDDAAVYGPGGMISNAKCYLEPD